MKRIFLVGAIALSLIFGSEVAQAHTVLISSSPKAGALLKNLPSQITLKFGDSLLTLGQAMINRVLVIDPKGVVISSRSNRVKGGALTNFLNRRWKRAGIYKVSYRVSAGDGHVVTGLFTFRVKN